jgi:hypothetical protein
MRCGTIARYLCLIIVIGQADITLADSTQCRQGTIYRESLLKKLPIKTEYCKGSGSGAIVSRSCLSDCPLKQRISHFLNLFDGEQIGNPFYVVCVRAGGNPESVSTDKLDSRNPKREVCFSRDQSEFVDFSVFWESSDMLDRI